MVTTQMPGPHGSGFRPVKFELNMSVFNPTYGIVGRVPLITAISGTVLFTAICHTVTHLLPIIAKLSTGSQIPGMHP